MLSQLVKWKIRNIKTLTYIQNHHFKNGKKFRATKLSLNQRKELRDILSKYDLFLEGRTENTFPFIGTLAIFRVAIDKSRIYYA